MQSSAGNWRKLVPTLFALPEIKVLKPPSIMIEAFWAAHLRSPSYAYHPLTPVNFSQEMTFDTFGWKHFHKLRKLSPFPFPTICSGHHDVSAIYRSCLDEKAARTSEIDGSGHLLAHLEQR